MRIWLASLAALCLFTAGSSLSFADALESLQAQATQLNLARHPAWLKLLHYDRHGSRSEVLTDSFFLSSEGSFDPAAELSATLAAYFLPWNDLECHARCEYPARYYWLAQYLPLPGYTVREPRCKRLGKWALLDRVKSVSLIMVSGYFGNPASTFGHALLKLNTDSKDAANGLFDLAINFGALVPENEATVAYVIKGVFGGYEAGFSDKYFYTQDLVYLRREFRDIWDYQLNLSEYERTLLILHIWEITGRKFRYFFLDQNCAYRLGELLELATNEELTERSRIWYIPVELFHRLRQVDAIRHAAGLPPLIHSMEFIPSSQRTLYHQFSELGTEEAAAANTILRQGTADLIGNLREFPPDRQAATLDAVLAYHQYRLISEQPEPESARLRAKDQVLLARLGLPPGPVASPDVPTLRSPAEGNRPMMMAAGLASNLEGYPYWRLRWAPFSQELVSRNSLEGGELAVLDTSFGVDPDGDQFFLDQVDFLRILKLKTSAGEIAGESEWSWRLHLGGKRRADGEEIRSDGAVSYGIGHAWQGKDGVIVYAMTDFAAHTLKPFLRLRPHLGVTSVAGPLRYWLYFGMEASGHDDVFRDIWGGKLQYHLSAQRALRLEYSNENGDLAALSIVSYW